MPPSAFENLFADRASVFYAAHGASAIYTDPAGHVTTGLTLAIEQNPAIQTDGTSQKAGELQSAEIMVPASQIANPVKGGSFTMGNEVWKIEITPIRKNGQHYCTCSRTGVDRLMQRRAKDNG